MTRFKIGDEVYLKAVVSNIDNSTAPYNIALSLEGGHLTYCWVDEKHLILADRVEITSEQYKFGDKVEVYRNSDWVNGLYVGFDNSPHYPHCVWLEDELVSEYFDEEDIEMREE